MQNKSVGRWQASESAPERMKIIKERERVKKARKSERVGDIEREIS